MSRYIACLWLVVCLSTSATALAWEPFRSPNANVERGNALMAEGKTEDALEAYSQAARELPDQAGVHLNRGLALSRAGRLEEAKQAFDLATRSKGDRELRADSYYNLGNSFMAEANRLADSEDLKGAQGQLREASDAFKQALRNRPGFRDAAWNLELAKRRMVQLEEEERKQQESEDQEKDDSQDQDGEEPPEDEQQGDEPKDDSKDDAQGDESEGDSKGDPQGDEPEQGNEPQDPSQDGDAGSQPPPEPEPAGPDAGAQQEPPTNDDPAPRPSDPGQPDQEPLPQHVKQVLDALQDGEDNLQRHEAQRRARQRPRRVEKDW